MDKIIKKLPDTIKVKIIKTSSGNYIAELPEYDNVFTQAENKEQLEFNINDLIMVYFDIPKKYHSKIWYKAADKSSANKIDFSIPLHFQFFISKSFLLK